MHLGVAAAGHGLFYNYIFEEHHILFGCEDILYIGEIFAAFGLAERVVLAAVFFFSHLLFLPAGLLGGAAVVAEFGQRLLLGIGKVEACKGIAMSGILATCSGLAVLSGVALLGGSGASGGILILCKSGKTAKGNSRESERENLFHKSFGMFYCYFILVFYDKPFPICFVIKTQ